MGNYSSPGGPIKTTVSQDPFLVSVLEELIHRDADIQVELIERVLLAVKGELESRLHKAEAEVLYLTDNLHKINQFVDTFIKPTVDASDLTIANVQ